jgi:NAD(P)-dependent dehydrogenase (short-subunit alcohol dehydrogenase family)
MLLDGKTAIITGAARGIGRACARTFAAQGADLVLVDIAQDVAGVPYPLGTRAQLTHTAAICEKQDSAAIAVEADVRDCGAVTSVVRQALDRFGRIDILLQCAGIAAPAGRAVHEITEQEWVLMLDIDLSGAWRMMKAVAPTMIAQRSGSIINVSSTAGLVGYRHFASYVTAKHGLIGLTKAAALDYAPYRIRVNAICPGSVRDAPEFEGRMLVEIARSLEISAEDYEETFLQSQPTNSLAEPLDVAEAALWLAGGGSTQVTGSVLTVDGGFTAR